MYLIDIFTISLNLAGITGMSVPCGLANGLPVGLQVIAPAFEEGRLFHVAHAFEQSTDHHKLRPSLAGKESI
jgi:aspartyl-tRNA(Asn)/glutamyl-tRNA(Gln) amidotransferase subunit A